MSKNVFLTDLWKSSCRSLGAGGLVLCLGAGSAGAADPSVYAAPSSAGVEIGPADDVPASPDLSSAHAGDSATPDPGMPELTGESAAAEGAERDASAGAQTAVSATPGGRLYLGLVKELPVDQIATLIRAVLQADGRSCSAVRDYQIARFGGGYRTLKVKCSDKPLYVVTARYDAPAEVSGGDGSVADLSITDGAIVSIMGMKASEYFSREQAAQARQAAQAQDPSDGVVVQVLAFLDRNFWAGVLAFNVLVLGLFGLSMRKLLRARRRPGTGGPISSVRKDLMMDESREVLPNVFEHPSGVFIGRGSHGKRRFFRSRLTAYLYATAGLKIGEISG